jgi:hypothetical protein
MSSAIAPAVAHLYRALLYLYPSPFRVEFGSEMVCDFEDAMSEALTMRGWSGVFVVWTFVAADLLRTIAIQWLRSGVPTVIAMAATWTISCCVLIAQQSLPRRDASLLIPPRTADQEMQIMLLASAVVVLLIAATVLLTGWFWMFVVKRRSRA